MTIKPQTQRWLGVFTLLVIVIIAYINRINIAILVVNDDFLEHFMIGNGQTSKGLLMTTFLLGYGLSAFFLTPILESLFHYRRALALSVFVWALICAISPLLGSLLALLMSRALLGIAEGPLFSLKTIYISDHFEPKNFGKANAITALGISIGLSIGFPLISFLVSQYGWKESFWVLAVINLVGGLSLIHFFIKPNPNSSLNLKENRLSIKDAHFST